MTGVFRALDFVFSVSATDPPLQDAVDHVYDACRVSGDATTQFTLLERGTDTTKIVVFQNDERLVTTSDEALALAYLIWQINQRAVAVSGARLLLHAAAASRGDRAVLLPAPSGGGKSTLVAGLVAAGFEYLTDDVCAVDGNGSCALPYPKPIAIAASAVHKLFDRPGAPVITGARNRFVGDDAFLSAADLGGTVASGAVPAKLVVVPDYRAGATTRLEPLSRAEAAVLLAEQSFNFNDLGAPGLFAIGELVRGCTCHRLTYSDLAAGVACVSELLAA